MGAHFVSDSFSMQTSVLLVACCLASCLATSQALSQSHHYLPWFGYQTVPAYRFPGVDQYHHYYPNNYNNYNQHSRLRQHPVAAVPVLPEVTLESSQESPPPPPPPPQPVFSPASDLLLPVFSPIQEEEEVGLVTGVVEPIPPSPSLPPAALSVAASSQYHAQDELGNTAYGYSNTNSAKHEVRDQSGVRGTYSWRDQAGHHTVHYVADHRGFRIID